MGSFLRAQKIRDAYSEMEKDYEVIGATGIEDKLQEKVVETIRAVQKAGIIPWMLTGDKKETAMNLAQAAGLLQSLTKVIDLCGPTKREVTKMVRMVHSSLQEPVSKHANSSLVVDGKAILVIMKNEELKEKFCEITCKCPTVVACR